jgi:hypothetical protein
MSHNYYMPSEIVIGMTRIMLAAIAKNGVMFLKHCHSRAQRSVEAHAKHGIKRSRDTETIDKLLTAYLRRADESTHFPCCGRTGYLPYRSESEQFGGFERSCHRLQSGH